MAIERLQKILDALIKNEIEKNGLGEILNQGTRDVYATGNAGAVKVEWDDVNNKLKYEYTRSKADAEEKE